MKTELDDNPDFEPISAEHVAPFRAVSISSIGKILELDVISHDPSRRLLEARIVRGIDYPGLRAGDWKVFAPYGYVYVLKEGGQMIESDRVGVAKDEEVGA